MNNKDLLDISKITNSPSISGGGYVISAEQLNPDIEGSLRSDINKKLEANDEILIAKTLKLYHTAQSFQATSESNMVWFKLCTLEVRYRFGDSVVVCEFVGHDTADCHKSAYVRFMCCVKQQDVMGNLPIIELWLINAINFKEEQLKCIITANDANHTLGEIWCGVSVNYTSTVISYPIMIGSVVPTIDMALLQPSEVPSGIFTRVSVLKTS